MNLRLLFPSLLFGLVLLLSMGNKNGRASSANRGNTGAPGDETSLGQPKTCMNCHNQGPITASLAISVLDIDNVEVTQYRPGQKYTARVKVTASGTGLMGYGFQMIALRDAGNTDLDGFSDVNPNNYKIASISNGRTYAEHDNISASNTFNVTWTAPPAGTGTVTFYSAGNGVNGNGTTSGDGAGFSSLKLTEQGTTAAFEPDKPAISMAISPNPVSTNARLDIGPVHPGMYRIKVFDSASKVVWQTREWLSDTGSVLEVPASPWAPGVYFVQLEGSTGSAIVKVLKL